MKLPKRDKSTKQINCAISHEKVIIVHDIWSLICAWFVLVYVMKKYDLKPGALRSRNFNLSSFIIRVELLIIRGAKCNRRQRTLTKIHILWVNNIWQVEQSGSEHPKSIVRCYNKSIEKNYEVYGDIGGKSNKHVQIVS